MSFPEIRPFRARHYTPPARLRRISDIRGRARDVGSEPKPDIRGERVLLRVACFSKPIDIPFTRRGIDNGNACQNGRDRVAWDQLQCFLDG